MLAYFTVGGQNFQILEVIDYVRHGGLIARMRCLVEGGRVAVVSVNEIKVA